MLETAKAVFFSFLFRFPTIEIVGLVWNDHVTLKYTQESRGSERRYYEKAKILIVFLLSRAGVR